MLPRPSNDSDQTSEPDDYEWAEFNLPPVLRCDAPEADDTLPPQSDEARLA